MENIYDKNTFTEHLIINRSKISANATMKWDHYHDFYEIYYYLGNEMNYFIDNKTISVKRNDMVFIDRYMLHRTLYTSQNHGERVLILFHPDILKMLGNDELEERVRNIFQRNKISFDPASTNAIDAILNRIYDYYINSQGTAGIMKARLGLLELLLNVSDIPVEENFDEQQINVPVKEKRVSEIVTFINSNYQNDLTLDVICKELFINKYYLCHIFKEITGLSVIDFINTKRLAEAERLLKYSSFSITNICESVGFNSISHFINLFKKSYNCTPREFRKSL